MAMHNPPHPGEFLIQVYLDPHNLSGRELAGMLGVAASTLNRILTGICRISPDMALRLTKTDVLFAGFSRFACVSFVNVYTFMSEELCGPTS
jgi:addiction module HigA family antidote